MKYLGNKQRIVAEILPVMMPHMRGRNAFVDAFCGSCSVIENVPPSDSYVRIANDKQKYLISMWKSLVNGKKFPETITRDYYTKVRERYRSNERGDTTSSPNDGYQDDDIGWTGFMGSYNGRFYDGGYSGHSVPTGTNGKTRDYIGENIRNTMKQIPRLKDVIFQSGDYTQIKMPPRSLIYCDIPYRDTKQYETTKGGFDYDRFYDWCRAMTRAGHKVFVSEYWMPEDFKCVWSKEITNSMHPTKTKRAVEKLFTL